MIRLEKIAISGYKGISERVIIQAKNFNVIVGKNDSGKSTILKALDLFINNKQYLPENLNNRTAQYTSVELFFSTHNISIVIDENVETTFEEENIIDDEGFLCVSKIWDGTKNRKNITRIFCHKKIF